MKTLLSFLLILTASLRAQTLETDKPTYTPGETITVTWSGGPGNGNDWLGIYRPNQTPGPIASTQWKYIGGAAAGSTTFSGLGLGDWKVLLFANDGYGVVAGPALFTLANPNPSIDSFSPDHNFIDDGVPIGLSWSITTNGQTINSITLSDGINPAVDVTGLTTYEVSPSATTTYTLDVNSGAVTKTARVLKGTANSATFSLAATAITAGQPVTATWDGVTANPDSWVGIYTKTDLPESQLSTAWNYLNGTKTAGGSVPAGSISFTLPVGEYYACLFVDGDYDIEQGPILFTVAPEPKFKVTSVVPNGNQVTITWESRAGFTYDVYASETLAGDPQAEWDEVTFMHPSEGDTTDFVETLGAPAARRFYKVYEFAE